MSKMPIVGRLLSVVVFLCAMVALLGCKNSSSPKLRITVNSWVGFGPLFVAQEMGIFKKHGLDVEIIKLENAADRRAALMGRRVDILGSTLDDLAVGLAQGMDAVAFACADFSNGSDGIIAAEEIDSLEKLVKVPIAVQPGFVNHFFLLYVLDKNAVPTSALRINPMTPDDAGAAFIAGSIDAAVTWEPMLSEGLKKRPGARVLARSDTYPEAILDLFVASGSWFREHPQSVVRFRKAWDEALTFIKNDPHSAYAVIGKNAGIDPGEVKGMLDGAKLLTSGECTEFLRTRIDDLAGSVKRLWKEAGFIDRDIDLVRNVKVD